MRARVTPCPWCETDCGSIDLRPVRGAHIDWFWRQLADVGDRRGDHDLTTGSAAVTAPNSPAERAAVLGLLGGRSPRAGQRIRVNLLELTARLHAHDVRLTVDGDEARLRIAGGSDYTDCEAI